MKTCKEDCLHYEVCLYQEICTDSEKKELDNGNCEYFTDLSEWVHLPSGDYTFTIRGDIANGIIIANCRAAENALECIKDE